MRKLSRCEHLLETPSKKHTDAKPSLFRQGFLLILFPSILNACLLVALTFYWSGIGVAVDESVRRTDAIVATCAKFSSVLGFGYTTLSESFNTPLTELELPSYQDVESSGKRDELSDSDLVALSSKVDVLRNKIEKLPQLLRGIKFTSNVQRLTSFSGILIDGVELSREFDGMLREQLSRSNEMWSVAEHRYTVLKSLLAVFLSLEVAMGVLLVGVFRRVVVNRLHKLVDNMLAMARLEGSWNELRGDEPMARLNRTIHAVTMDLRAQDQENQLLERVLIENILAPSQRAETFVYSLDEASQAEGAVSDVEDARKTTAEWSRSASVAMERIRFFAHRVLTRNEANPHSMSGREYFPLKAAIEDCHTELRPLLEGKCIQIIDDCNDVSVFAVRPRVVQVLINLLVNAVRFSPLNSSIIVRASKVGSLVYISVIDSGPGIAEELRAKVFDRFFSPEENASDGFGLGLAICRSIVESQGGELGVNSVADGGSEFWFSLPREGEDAAGSVRSSVVSPPASIRWSLYWRGVLLIVIPILAQLATLAWVNSRLMETHNLLVSERELMTLSLSEKLLWLESFRGSSLTALQLVSRSETQREEALRSVSIVRKRLKVINSLPVNSPEARRLIDQVEDFLGYQNRIQEMTLSDRAPDLNKTLRLLPQVIGRFENVNHDFGVLAAHQIQELSLISGRQIALQRDSQAWLAVLLLTNLIIAAGFLRYHDKLFGRRIAALELHATSLQRLEEIPRISSPKDEIDFLQNQLAAVSVELISAAKLREEVLNTVAHDIRSPLQTLLLILTMIAESEQRSILSLDAGALDSVKRGLRSSIEVVSHLLSVNKLRSAAADRTSDAAALSDVVSDAVANVADSAAESGVSVSIGTVQGNADKLRADATRAGQLIEHALNCAIRLSRYDSEVIVESCSEGEVWTVRLQFDTNRQYAFDLQNALVSSSSIANLSTSDDIVLGLNCLICALLCKDLNASIRATESTLELSI